MEAKLRSYFFIGKLDNLVKYQGKKDDNIALLIERALVMMKQPTTMKLRNLETLASYQQNYEAVDLASDGLEEVLSLIFSLNSNQESSLVDSIKPETSEKRILLACCLLKLRRPDIVENMMKAALSQEEEEGGYSLILAISFFLKGEFEESGAIISELLSKFGDSPVLLNIYALTFIHEGNYSKAENVLNRALELSKQFGVNSYTEITLRNMIACKRITGETFLDFEE